MRSLFTKGFHELTEHQYEAVCRSFRRRIDPPTSSKKSGALAREAEVELAKVPWYGVLLAGGLSGVTSWLATFPFDTIKTRMQTVPQGAGRGTVSTRQEMGMIKTIVHCYRTQGAKSFFAGLSPTLIRAVPVNIITFGAFEVTVGLLTGRQ